MPTYTHGTQELANIEKSLKDDVYANLVTTEGLDIRWNGHNKSVKALSEYIDIFTQITDKRFVRVVSGTSSGYITEMLMTFNCHVRNDYIFNTDNFRHIALRDIVGHYYDTNSEIMLKDFTDSKSNIYNCTVHDVTTDQNMRQDEEFHTYLYEVELYLIERR